MFLCNLLQPQSDLQGLIQVLVCIFGEEPPVFAKSQASQSPAGGSTQPPYTPYPTAGKGYIYWTSTCITRIGHIQLVLDLQVQVAAVQCFVVCWAEIVPLFCALYYVIVKTKLVDIFKKSVLWRQKCHLDSRSAVSFGICEAKNDNVSDTPMCPRFFGTPKVSIVLLEKICLLILKKKILCMCGDAFS